MLLSLILSAGLLSSGLHPESDTWLPEPDLPVVDSLNPVTVTADKGVVVSRTDTLYAISSFTVSDLLHHSPGLYVGDNGGAAGLKTVSLRGMGSAHTAIYVDGVRVGNIQSGQGDLGALGLENFSGAVVDYAQNSVSFSTARPRFGDAPVSVRARFQAGSFATYQPYLRADFRLNDRLSLSVNGAAVFSKGDFPCGEGIRRENNDLKQGRAGVDLWGIMDGGDFHVKAYYNEAHRGTPGSLSWPSDDRQNDRNAFLQGTLRKRFQNIYTLRVSAKGSYDNLAYTSSWGDSRYEQTEFQLNTSHDFQLFRWWKISLAADAQFDALHSDSYNASRLSVLAAFASAFRTDVFSANVAFEYNGAFDTGSLSRNVFSPSLDVKVRLTDDLELVAFSRRAYRVPTFNELYYVGYGNPELRPEDAWLNDLGLSFARSVGASSNLYAKLDGFCNFLKDKIISAPTVLDPNIWLPYNVGRVRSAGVDAVAGYGLQKGDWKCAVDARYSWLSAVDTTPDSSTYGQNVPYSAAHSAVLDARVSWKDLELRPVWMIRAGRSDGYGDLPSWNTLDVNLSKKFTLGKSGVLSVWVAAKNILDCRYELVSGYPMPGRSFLGGVEYLF